MCSGFRRIPGGKPEKIPSLHLPPSANKVTQVTGIDYILLHNLYYIKYPDEFADVIPRLDGPQVPNMIAPDWPSALVNTTPAFGIGVPGPPQHKNGCQWDAHEEIPITVYYTDPNGDKNTVAISVAHQSSDQFATTQNGDKEHWKVTAPYWGDNWWEHSINFQFQDEEGNVYDNKDGIIGLNGEHPYGPDSHYCLQLYRIRNDHLLGGVGVYRLWNLKKY